ncbi:MAG: diguanylate cyclase [Pseudomonadota bacterium]
MIEKKQHQFQTSMLIPVSLIFLIMTLVVVVGAFLLQYKNLKDNFIETIGFADRIFKDEIAHDVQIMNVALLFLKQNKKIQKAWLDRDKEKLFKLSQQQFDSLKQEQKITHLYFTDLTGKVFLRVHNRLKAGDILKRYTTTEAIRTQKISVGMEFGIHHNFTLRSVHPWYVNGELVGLIEMGKEIADLTKSLAKTLNAELFIVFDKSKFKRKTWEEGIKLYDLENTWNILSDGVVVGNTLAKIPDKIENFLKFNHQKKLFDLELNNKSFLGGYIDVKNVKQETVAKMVLLKDISSQFDLILSFIVSLFFYSLMIILLSFYWFKFHIKKMDLVIQSVNNELSEQANTDQLTEVSNRRHFFERVNHLLAKQNMQSYALLMMDIDDFKKVNDHYGHDVGDMVLKQFAIITTDSIRKKDIFARFGGEEFVVVMPDCSLDDALEKAENIRYAIAKNNIIYAQHNINITVSIGVTQILSIEKNINEALKSADLALYCAKKCGKNCIKTNHKA